MWDTIYFGSPEWQRYLQQRAIFTLWGNLTGDWSLLANLKKVPREQPAALASGQEEME